MTAELTAKVTREGQQVLPGDDLYSDTVVVAEDSGSDVSQLVRAGEGAMVRVRSRRSREGVATVVERAIVATRAGSVQWDASVVSVVSLSKLSSSSGAGKALQKFVSTEADDLHSSVRHEHVILAGDLVHVRITRVSKVFAAGDVIAVRGEWITHRHGYQSSGFRGLLRPEDIKPFRPSKDCLAPDHPEESMRPGDVVIAQVLSQADAKVFQLSTIPEMCGVVEATVPLVRDVHSVPTLQRVDRVQLLHVPNQRVVMRHPRTGEEVKRWTPLIR